ncbi:Gamma-glutamyltranspeptidase @ Glutathione hydrolase [hydrothermal vent metagenome]|uniref:Gamma-glutamyltranspeptidase @ Glutathione hydrolase n=1 Tax=hydrothermal vent metagenome TaxID=652676 RepID=A0A3B0RAC9_9ZZZZ
MQKHVFNRLGLFGFVLIGLLIASCGASTSAPAKDKPSIAKPAMVAAANPLAVEAGLEILRRGGSAVDAAVAVQSVLGLVEPQSSGLGGGAFLVYYDAASGKVSSFDGRETAPNGASADMFLGEDGQPLGYLDAVNSGHAVGVPGAMAMLGMAQAKHGKVSWAGLFNPALKLAETGFAVSPHMADLLNRYGRRVGLDQQASAREYFFLADGSPLPEGYIRNNAAYAASLRKLAQNPRALLEGELAEQIVAAVAMGPRPGALSLADLRTYQPKERAAVCRPYKEFQLCSAPPPSSGGQAINATFGILSHFKFSEAGAKDPANWHLLIEALRLAYADRDRYMADDAQVDVPLNGMLDASYLAERAKLIQPDTAMARALPGNPAGAAFGRDDTHEEKGTSHFSIIDQWGNAVSMTTTIESIYGNKRFVGGFLLNNQLTDFARNPVDAAGLPLANAPAPGKRPRSSMSPTIVLGADAKPVLLAGSPGGNSIISYTAKALVGVLDWGLSPQQAVDLPNVVARGDITRIGAFNLDPALVPALVQMGHEIRATKGENSGLHLIEIMPDGSLRGGADSRREGVARQP